MTLIKRVLVDDEEKFLFWCPGCQTHMWFELGRWTWNGNFENPTVSPSILWTGACGTHIEPGGSERRCHLFIADGQLRFLDDCTHEFKGRTIPMGEVAW